MVDEETWTGRRLWLGVLPWVVIGVLMLFLLWPVGSDGHKPRRCPESEPCPGIACRKPLRCWVAGPEPGGIVVCPPAARCTITWAIPEE